MAETPYGHIITSLSKTSTSLGLDLQNLHSNLLDPFPPPLLNKYENPLFISFASSLWTFSLVVKATAFAQFTFSPFSYTMYPFTNQIMNSLFVIWSYHLPTNKASVAPFSF